MFPSSPEAAAAVAAGEIHIPPPPPLTVPKPVLATKPTTKTTAIRPTNSPRIKRKIMIAKVSRMTTDKSEGFNLSAPQSSSAQLERKRINERGLMMSAPEPQSCPCASSRMSVLRVFGFQPIQSS